MVETGTDLENDPLKLMHSKFDLRIKSRFNSDEALPGWDGDSRSPAMLKSLEVGGLRGQGASDVKR